MTRGGFGVPHGGNDLAAAMNNELSTITMSMTSRHRHWLGTDTAASTSHAEASFSAPF